MPLIAASNADDKNSGPISSFINSFIESYNKSIIPL